MTIIQPPGVQWVVNLLQLKLGYACDISPQISMSRKKYVFSWEFHVNDRSESSWIYDMTIGQGRDLIGELNIIMNFNDHNVTWGTDNIPMKDRDTALYHQQRI
jgi:hypothetical protein